MWRKRVDLLFILGIFLPSIFVFRALLLPSTAVWGDAPYFYPEMLKSLFAEPFVWTNWGNNFGGVNQIIWIYPLMFLYGLLHLVFNATNDVIIRVIFYFPAILLAFITPVVFTRYLGFPIIVRFFTSLLYGLNTYFLLLIDGGQVGVALAYGIFPISVLFLHKLEESFNRLNFFICLGVLFALSIADVRLALVSVLTIIVWCIVEALVKHDFSRLKNLRFLIPLGLSMIGLSSYWLVPTLRLGVPAFAQDVSNGPFLSLLDTLFLFQPHWPANEFGKVSPPLFYFVGIPLLVFGSLLFHRDRKILIFASCFLFFAFLSKGESPPLRNWYAWITVNLPFGVAFRDSSKFFTLLLLFSGILIGTTVEHILRFVQGRRRIVFVLLLWVYLLFLIHPAFLGRLNGVLGSPRFDENFEKIYKNFSEDNSFFRSAWFIERYPLGFHTNEKPALDAKFIVNMRPFAALNVGTTDRFNFIRSQAPLIHNSQFLDWFDLLGIKYLIFSGNPRKVQLNEEEKKDWQDLLELTDSTTGLQKTEWGTDFPIYQLPSVKPRVFAVEKLLAVVGGDNVYEKLHVKNSNFSVGNQGFVFLEDGKFDPGTLEKVSSNSTVLIFNQKEKLDLALSFLSKFFIGPTENKQSQWAIRLPEEHLKWKFELLVNKIETAEFDYNKGIAFSSQPNEKLVFSLDADQNGEYVLVIRHMSAPDSRPLRVIFNGESREISTTRLGQFEWYTEETKLTRGNYNLVLENPNGFQVVNIVGLMPKNDWENASKLADDILTKFPIAGINDISSLGTWQEVDYKMVSEVEYTVAIPPEANWLVFSDTYNPEWVLGSGGNYRQSYPFYSAINGFNVSGLQEGEVIFNGQKYVRLGMYLSLGTLVLLATLFVWAYSRSRRK